MRIDEWIPSQCFSRIKQNLLNGKINFFSGLIATTSLRNLFVAGTRRLIFDAMTTLQAFIWQALSCDGSCKEAVMHVLLGRLSEKLPANSVNTGPYCKARQLLPLSFIKETVKDLGYRFHTTALPAWKWKGHNVVIADGTTLLMPDTKANQSAYPQQVHCQPVGLGFPIMRLVALVSLSTGSIIDYATGP